MLQFIRQSFRPAAIIALLISSLVLSGCGFKLRGKITVPENLRVIHLIGEDIELLEEIEKGLRFSDIVISDTVANAAVLDLSDTLYERTTNTTNSTGQTTSYILDYDVEFELFDPDGEEIKSDFINETRTFFYDPTEILVAEREEEFLKEDMQKAISQRILRLLSKI